MPLAVLTGEGVVNQHGLTVQPPLEKLEVDVRLTVRLCPAVLVQVAVLRHGRGQLGRQVVLRAVLQPGQGQIGPAVVIQGQDVFGAVRRPPEPLEGVVAVGDEQFYAVVVTSSLPSGEVLLATTKSTPLRHRAIPPSSSTRTTAAVASSHQRRVSLTRRRTCWME